jgi:hypothetical protein
MIYFFADNHYDSHPGKNIFENLPVELKNKIKFFEDDWSELENSNWQDDCELMILNLIGDTCNIPHPNSNAEEKVKKYLQSGGNMLLLHGSSAAFWQWDWWRNIVGFRWVRPNDPDQIAASTHPIKPYSLRICKARHELINKLIPLDLPSDEIYTELEQVSPALILMDTVITEGVYPQCLENYTPWGGKFVHFIPGHNVEVTTNDKFLNNIVTIINYLNGDK